MTYARYSHEDGEGPHDEATAFTGTTDSRARREARSAREGTRRPDAHSESTRGDLGSATGSSGDELTDRSSAGTQARGLSYVYVLRDATGTVIYVGATVNPRNRLRQHASALWWIEVDQARTTTSAYASSALASEAEQNLIASHQPRHNRAGVTGPYIPYRPSELPRGSRSASSTAIPELAAITARMQLRGALISEARGEGATWAAIASALGMSRAGVIKLHNASQ